MGKVATFIRKPAATWTAQNPILRRGRVGYESDTDRNKIGDGSTRWNDLNYEGAGFDENGSLVDGAGIPFLRGAVLSGEWMTPPSIFRLRLTGTGTVVMDARDSLGVETLAVASYSVSGATDQIEFPYAGDNAVAIRITLTGTATAEVI